MKLCFISPGYNSINVLNGQANTSGGAEAQVAYLAAAFANLGHQVQLIYGYGRASSIPRVIANVECIEAWPAWKRPGSLLTCWLTLRKSRAELVYARLPDDFLWLPGLYTKLHTKSKFIYALAHDTHCNPWKTYDYHPWFHNPLHALTLRTANIVAVQHDGQTPLVRPYTNGDIFIIPNLVRSVSKQARNFECTTIDAVWIARIRPEKQLHIFLDIIESLPNIRFAIVGDFNTTLKPETQNKLKNRTQALKNLLFLGSQPVDRVIQLLIDSKVLVNTSSWEGFPNTMLEAWSVGVPVVSLMVDPGGIIQRKAMGLVSGTVTQMTLDIARLVQTPPLNIEMGQRGLVYVREQHSFAQVCQAFEQIMPSLQVRGQCQKEDT